VDLEEEVECREVVGAVVDTYLEEVVNTYLEEASLHKVNKVNLMSEMFLFFMTI
jgi:hypothetical protein